jgi:ADP-heptose:LPS heptosyltransferase
MREKHLSLSGKTTLKQTAALIKLARLFIGNDCGPLHIAAAVGTPTISIFGPTDPQKLAPLGEAHIYVRSDAACSPCYRQTEEYQQVCQKYDCMERIQVAEVVEAFNKLIERGAIK